MTKSYKTKTKVSNGILFVVMLLLGICMIIPFVWTLSSSFKNNNEIFAYPIKWIPEVFRWSNYAEVCERIPFVTYYLNTLKLAVIVTVGQVITCSLAAYSFSKMQYPGRDKIFLCYLATLMVPWHAIMIPQFLIIKTLGLNDSHWSLILINIFSAFGVFLLRQFMMGIPEELSEAARIDGLGRVGIITKILAPMCRSTLFTVTLVTFTNGWNAYFWPKIIAKGEKRRVLTVGLAYLKNTFAGAESMNNHEIMAGAVMAVVPVIILFFIFQKYMLTGYLSLIHI